MTSGCLDLCGRGPNVKILSPGDQNVESGIKTFKAARSLLEKHGVKLRKLDFQVAEVKYEARRGKSVEERLAKVQNGWKLIGGESSTKEPQLASTLLALRAEERLNGKEDVTTATAALEDARKALQLSPDFAAAHLSSALAMLRLGQVEDARSAFQASQDARGSFNKDHLRMVMKQLADAPKAPPKETPVEAEVKETKETTSVAPKAEAKTAAKAPAKVPAKVNKSGEVGKDEKSDKNEKSEKNDKNEKSEKSDKNDKKQKSKSDKELGEKSKLTKQGSTSKLSKSGSGIGLGERTESSKKVKNSESPGTKKPATNQKPTDQEAVTHEDAQTEAADLMSVSIASPCVAGELTESGLIEPDPSGVLGPGWRSSARCIVSLWGAMAPWAASFHSVCFGVFNSGHVSSKASRLCA